MNENSIKLYLSDQNFSYCNLPENNENNESIEELNVKLMDSLILKQNKSKRVSVNNHNDFKNDTFNNLENHINN